MAKKHKTYFNWSSGKDASLALYYLKKLNTFNIDKLLTCVNVYHDRVSMHGLRRKLLEQQAKSIGIPLKVVEIPKEPTMDEYNCIMRKIIDDLKSEGYTHCGFGDIFLEDLRVYREEQLKPYNISSHFPLWKKNTKTLISNFLNLGFKAIVVCINSSLLDKSFVGREIDANFIKDLPKNIDPCGENGEFHTFCYDGPIFSKPISFDIGEKIFREYKNPKKNNKPPADEKAGFWFCDLIPN